MDIFDGLTMIGGLSLFLFGMTIMGHGFGTPGRQQAENDSGPADLRQAGRPLDGPGGHGDYTELIGDHSHGSWFRQFWAYEPETGD